MRVGDFLKANRQQPVTCTPEESVEAVAARLSAHNIGAMPVCGAGGALVGVISERDLVRAFAKDSARLREKRVRDLMSREVITCAPQDSTAVAEKLMNEHRVRHLPVVDGAKLVGMLSIRDAIVARLHETRDEVNVLRDAVIAARHA
ncbi:MAG: CBS domain-containing protein [Roseiarcus sp.]